MKIRAKAIAIPYKQSFVPAFESARNFMMFVADKMYGTPERVRITYAIAVLLTLLAMILSSSDVRALQVCPT